MNRKFLSACIAAAIFAFAPCAFAETTLAPPAETQMEIDARDGVMYLLTSNNYKQLDERINGYQQKYEKGEFTDVNMRNIFRVFKTSEDHLEEHYNNWVKAFPKSYAARVTRGIYYIARARDARGDNYISETSQQQIDGMQKNMQMAGADLEASIPLTAKPLLSYFYLMNIAGDYGAADAKKALLAAVDKFDPKNFIMRYLNMLYLETRWGGSLEQMKAYREICKKAGLSDKLMWHLDGLIRDEEKWLAKNQPGKTTPPAQAPDSEEQPG